MDLANGRRGEWYRVELNEPVLQRLAVLLFDHSSDVLETLGTHLVLQFSELSNDLPRHHVKPCGKELAHLDKNATLAYSERAEGGGNCP
jgi:hypothetical protein